MNRRKRIGSVQTKGPMCVPLPEVSYDDHGDDGGGAVQLCSHAYTCVARLIEIKSTAIRNDGHNRP